MNRFVRIILHVILFAIGIASLANSNFWNWGLLRGMLLPIVATGFLIYLILFILIGGYRDFYRASSRPAPDRH